MKNNELESILAEVEIEIAGLLKSQTSALRKAGGDSLSEASASPEASASSASPEASASEGSEGSASASPEASASEGEPAPGAPEAAMQAPGAPAPEAPGAEGAPMDPSAQGAPADPNAQPGQEQADPAALEAQYEQMPPEMLKAHYLAAKSAIFKLMGAGQEAAPAPEAPPMASPSAGAAPMPPPAMKAELKIDQKPNGGMIKKSEDDGMQELKAQVEVLTKALTMMAEQPVRRAVTGVSFVAKPEEKPEAKTLSKSEITTKLAEKTADPKLAKSDRELVNGFYDGRVSVAEITHLLK